MEYAKKLALVDPRVLERHQEYKELQKPVDLKAKSELSLDMRRVLDDDSISDDVKCKMYRNVLDRYRGIKKFIPEETTAGINPINPPVVVTPKKSTRKRKQKKEIDWLSY